MYFINANIFIYCWLFYIFNCICFYLSINVFFPIISIIFLFVYASIYLFLMIISLHYIFLRLSDFNGIQTHNHLVPTQTLNYLGKLAKFIELFFWFRYLSNQLHIILLVYYINFWGSYVWFCSLIHWWC